MFEKYAEKLSLAYKQSYGIIADIKTTVSKIRKEQNNIPLIKDGKIDDIFKVISHMNTVDSLLYRVYDIINTKIDIDTMVSDMSNTFLLGIESDFKNIVLKYSMFDNNNTSINTKIIHHALDDIKSSPVELIDSLFNKYSNTVNLYAHYMQYKLDTVDPSSKEYILILDFLEMAKIKILSKLLDKQQVASDIKHNKPMQNFGLIAMWQHMDEKQVLQQALNLIRYEHEHPRNPGRMYGGYTPHKLKNMSDIFKKKRLGLFIIVSISSNPVDFNFKSLIHRKTAEKYILPDFCGVNDIVLKKYDVIKNITTDFKTPHTNT